MWHECHTVARIMIPARELRWAAIGFTFVLIGLGLLWYLMSWKIALAVLLVVQGAGIQLTVQIRETARRIDPGWFRR